MTRAQEAEENYLIKRELATIKQQSDEANTKLEQAESTIRELQQQQQWVRSLAAHLMFFIHSRLFFLIMTWSLCCPYKCLCTVISLLKKYTNWTKCYFDLFLLIDDGIHTLDKCKLRKNKNKKNPKPTHNLFVSKNSSHCKLRHSKDSDLRVDNAIS